LTATDEVYGIALREFNDLIRSTFKLSVRLRKLTGDTRKQIASAMFAKVNLCALSITKLLPPDSKVLSPQETVEMKPEKFCDISSVASLCRNLIEASNRLY